MWPLATVFVDTQPHVLGCVVVHQNNVVAGITSMTL